MELPGGSSIALIQHKANLRSEIRVLHASDFAIAGATARSGALQEDDIMTQKFQLASTPEGIVPALLAHLNSLDVEAMLDFYDPEGMIIDATGTPHVGRKAIGAELEKYFSLGLKMSIIQRHMFVADNIAALTLDWSYIGTARDGTMINMVATATDIARRGNDGLWRYLIDNPFGSQRRD